MKLYTEEQVLNMLRSFHNLEMNVQLCMLKLTPMELPSDEDINIESEITYRQYPSNPKEMTDWKYGEDVNVHRKRKAFVKGAKWMRDKILNK